MRTLLAALRPLLLLAGGILIINTISRLALVVVFYSRVSEVDAVGFILKQGFRFDLVIVGMTLIVPMLIFPALMYKRSTIIVWRNLMMIYLPIVMVAVLFMELATVPFAEQFDARPNDMFFAYIGYPNEILSTLWNADRLQLLIGLAVVLSFAYGVFMLCRMMSQSMQPVSGTSAIPASIAICLILGIMIRSSLGHRPVSPSTLARTSDSLVNDLPLNSLYTLAYAAYAMRSVSFE